MLVYKVLCGLALQYLSDFCQPVSAVSGRNGLRSSTCGDLFVISTATNFEQRSFKASAPLTWNQLPQDNRKPSVTGVVQIQTQDSSVCVQSPTLTNMKLTLTWWSLQISSHTYSPSAPCYGPLEIVGLLLLLSLAV